MSDEGKKIDLSVLVPTRNRPEVLLRTLAALETQTLERDRFEVIVIDDGSHSDQLSAPADYQPSYRYKFHSKTRSGLAATRNFAARLAQGRIILFLDDDVIPAEDTLRQHLTHHDPHGAPAVVVGSLPYPPDLHVTSFLWYLEKSDHYDLFRDPKKYPGGSPPLPPLNGNSSIPRDLFFKIGAYDETFRDYGGEDLEIGCRLAKTGVKFIYVPQAVGFHNHVKTFECFCRDMKQAGKALIQIYQKHPDIKNSKKIDVLTEPFANLPIRKKIMKLVMKTTAAFPAILLPPRIMIQLFGNIYAFRHLLFYCYRWIAYHQYASGMRYGLKNIEPIKRS